VIALMAATMLTGTPGALPEEWVSLEDETPYAKGQVLQDVNSPLPAGSLTLGLKALVPTVGSACAFIRLPPGQAGFASLMTSVCFLSSSIHKGSVVALSVMLSICLTMRLQQEVDFSWLGQLLQ
jgi:hypothetical protein